MKKFYFLFFLFFICTSVFAQGEGDFAYGKIENQHLDAKDYPQDSTASAYVIKEFGRAYISDRENEGLFFTYHVKIKILNNKGLDQANVVIPLSKSSDRLYERLVEVRGVTSNLENGTPQFTHFDDKKVYTEKINEYYERKKFTLPNVKVGSIIEYQYTIESPFIFNYRTWHFQSDIPKVESEFWAKIPGNYEYNIALMGFKKLDRNDAEIIKSCFSIGGGVADCSLMKYGMKDIPAFVEEDYMTAPENFMSTLKFELMNIKYFNGTVKHITRTWEDIYKELKTDPEFGVQIKRHSELFKDEIAKISVDDNPNNRARGVYNLIKNRYQWDNYYGKYAENELKKAYETRSGNVADINLALIGALQYAGLDTEPVLLSTRSNGLPNTLFPVMSDFNYVVAKVNLGNESYLLDGTDKLLPFGMLPFECLNKIGRVIGKDSSYWVNLVPKKKFKQVDFITLKMDSSGNFVGKIIKRFNDYQAFYQRKEIKKFASTDEYIENLDEKYPNLKIKKYTIANLDSLDLPLTEEYEVRLEGFEEMGDNLMINPFVFNKMTENPFKLNERVYPIDFGAQKDFTTIFQLELPKEYQVKLLPASVALQLPENTGKYIYKGEVLNQNMVAISEFLTINRPEIEGAMYPYLKELYNNIVQTNKSNIIISRIK